MSSFIDDSFFIFSLLPFLNYYEKVSLLSISKSVHQQFDIDRVWHKIVPFMKEANHVLIKKSIHFFKLMQRHSMCELIQEVCSQEQWDVILLSLNFYPKGCGRMRLKTLVRSMIPDFLNKGKNRVDIFRKHVPVPLHIKRSSMHSLNVFYCRQRSNKRRRVVVKE